MKKRLHTRGFTLAEILITLVIVGFIGALGVPMLGQQKLNKPEVPKTNHGVLECYYDADGNLHQFRADNSDKDSMNGTDTIVADFCTFAPPIANFYTIQVIGAGGAGGMYEDTNTPNYNITLVEGDSGSVSTGTAFATDLASAPQWVNEKWDAQWNNSNAKVPKYTVTSPLGAAGDTICVRALKTDLTGEQAATCAEKCTSITSECWESYKSCITETIGKGGDGGDGAKYTVSVKLKNNYSVGMTTDTNKARLDFGPGGFLELKSSGSGTDAKKASDHVVTPGVDGQSFTPANHLSSSGLTLSSQSNVSGNTAPTSCNYTGEASGGGRDAGIISVSNVTSIGYESQALAIRALFGYKGKPGNVVSRVVSKLPETALRLRPAKTSDDNSIVLIYTPSTGGYQNFVIAEPGEQGGTHVAGTEDIKLDLTANKDFPFPSEHYPEVFEPVKASIPLFTASGYESKFPSLIANPQLAPGRSGMGAYPVLVTGSANAGYKINGVSVNSNPTSFNYTSNLASYTCLSGQTPKVAPNGQYYCEATAGNPGAIAIIW